MDLISSWSMVHCFRTKGFASARKGIGYFHQASSWKMIRSGWDAGHSGRTVVTGTMADSVTTCRFLLISIPKLGSQLKPIRGGRTEDSLLDRLVAKFFPLLNHQVISFMVIISDDPVEDGLLYYTFNNADRF